MIAIFDFVPDKCPSCGEVLLPNKDDLSMNDYCVGCGHTCLRCGLHFQYVETDRLLTIADDLRSYIDK